MTEKKCNKSFLTPTTKDIDYVRSSVVYKYTCDTCHKGLLRSHRSLFFNKTKRAESFGFREETYLDLMKTGNFTTHFSYNFMLNVKSR